MLRWAYETSQGNALYVRELIAGAVDAGTLTKDHGLWHMAGPPPISRSLTELVAQRIDALTDADRTPLELLALGEPLALDELVELSDYDSLVAVEARGLVLVGAPARATWFASRIRCTARSSVTSCRCCAADSTCYASPRPCSDASRAFPRRDPHRPLAARCRRDDAHRAAGRGGSGRHPG